jgi:CxxC motif-containing protein
MPVKTDKNIPKGKIFEAMASLDELEVKAPFKAGDVVVPNLCGAGVSFVSTRSL